MPLQGRGILTRGECADVSSDEVDLLGYLLFAAGFGAFAHKGTSHIHITLGIAFHDRVNIEAKLKRYHGNLVVFDYDYLKAFLSLKVSKSPS
jgi:hypothetical protein